MNRITVFLTTLFVCLAANAQQPKLNSQNIDEIIKALTLEEKVNLIVGGHDSDAKVGETMIGSQEKLVPGAAGITNGIERLGIPQTVMTDGPAGVRISTSRKNDDKLHYATGFPIATLMASTWDTALIEETTRAMGNEVLEFGCDVLLAPGTNIHRHPLCGRNFEYFSEDPLLSGKMAAAYINGVQSCGVGTSIKHFVANNQETLRMYNDSRVSQRALREIYLKPFEIAIREANPWTVMSSYNRLNGTYTQQSYDLLTTILRDEWHYDGLVVTDWTGTRKTIEQIKAGNDLLQPGTDQQIKDLIEGAKNGSIPMETIDRAVRRILLYILKTPRFKGYAYSDAPDLKAHAGIVRKCGSEGMVLLKNEAALPLKGNECVALFGVTSYKMLAGGTGSGDVNKAYISNLSDALTEQNFTLSSDLESFYESYKTCAINEVKAEFGNDWTWKKPVLDEASINRNIIDRQAEKADVAIVTIGRTAGESKDRRIEDDFDLTQLERQLIADVCDAFHLKGKPVVVVLNTSGVMETASWKTRPDAILLAWQPGQEAGRSVADILSGKVCPSGKLPTTFPNNCTDPLSARNFPLFGGNEKMAVQDWDPRSTIEYTDYAEGVMVGYRYFQTENKSVSYPFGYGLSYTTFDYSHPSVKKVKGGFEVSVTVTNSGSCDGKEVVELYVSAPKGTMDKPESELKAFAKTRSLHPGEKQVITMRVADADLASYDESRSMWVADKGIYTLRLASDVSTTKAVCRYSLKQNLSYKNQ